MKEFEKVYFVSVDDIVFNDFEKAVEKFPQLKEKITETEKTDGEYTWYEYIFHTEFGDLKLENNGAKILIDKGYPSKFKIVTENEFYKKYVRPSIESEAQELISYLNDLDKDMLAFFGPFSEPMKSEGLISRFLEQMSDYLHKFEDRGKAVEIMREWIQRFKDI